MKLKKVLAVSLAAAMTLSMAACGGSSSDSSAASDDATTGSVAATTTGSGDAAETTDGALNYASIKLGEDYTDITTTIHVFNQRTDMSEDSYPGKNWEAYIADFNEMYPNITVEVETDTNYSDDSLLRLQSGDWGDIMMIPAVDKADLSEYFLPYGTLDEMEGQIKFANTWDYDGLVYGVPSTGNAQGIVYNKRVFTEAGVAETPKTPDEFIAALQAIKDYDSSIIPLYTNYADGWPMEQWDGQIAGTTTGDSTYMNQKLLHTKDPFQDYGDNTHPYALYKVLYDAVADGLTEDDFTTTSWEDSKGMINRGEIAADIGILIAHFSFDKDIKLSALHLLVLVEDDLLLQFHDIRLPLFLRLLVNLIRELRRRCSLLRRVGESSESVELHIIDKLHQLLVHLLRLSRKSADKRCPERDVRNPLSQMRDNAHKIRVAGASAHPL